jgi:hypothetical protein
VTDAAAVEIRELREPALQRRLDLVGRSATLTRPAVQAVQRALMSAATGLTVVHG